MAPDERLSLPDISADHPAGESMEFDPDFAELERLAQGKPEQQFGTTIVPAEEPDWRAVIDSATALLTRTHDLRVLAQLGVARLHRDGLPAYAETLTTIRQLLRTRWAEVHPQLDPEDDNDPLPRANGLLLLAQPGRVIRTIRALPLARSARAGTVSWRDIAFSNGTLELPPGTPKLAAPVIAGIFRDSDPAALAGLRAAVETALASAIDIPAAFDEQAGHGTGPDFTNLQRLLREIKQMLDTHAPAPASTAPEADMVDEGSAAVEMATAVTVSTERAQPVMNIQTMGPPTNRADALRMLDLVVEFYQRNEPSSPLPLLIARARRLAEMGFMDILRDLAPDGIGQVERIAGTGGS